MDQSIELLIYRNILSISTLNTLSAHCFPLSGKEGGILPPPKGENHGVFTTHHGNRHYFLHGLYHACRHHCRPRFTGRRGHRPLRNNCRRRHHAHRGHSRRFPRGRGRRGRQTRHVPGRRSPHSLRRPSGDDGAGPSNTQGRDGNTATTTTVPLFSSPATEPALHRLSAQLRIGDHGARGERREPTPTPDSPPVVSPLYTPTPRADAPTTTPPRRILFIRLRGSDAVFGTTADPRIFAGGGDSVASFTAAATSSTLTVPTLPPPSVLPYPSFLVETMAARRGAPPFFSTPEVKQEGAPPATHSGEGPSTAPAPKPSTPTTPNGGRVLRRFATAMVTANRRPGLRLGTWSPAAMGYYLGSTAGGRASNTGDSSDEEEYKPR
uniref:Uncharacterized protein n=1 Tax=Arundo donax TaxID=35708 RepID=A0A0A8Y2B6_ARUDO